MKKHLLLPILYSVSMKVLISLGIGLNPLASMSQDLSFPLLNQTDGKGELLGKIVQLADSTTKLHTLQAMPDSLPAMTEKARAESKADIAGGQELETDESITTTEDAEEAVDLGMESPDSVFVLGKKADYDGLRMADVGENGVMILIEDNIEPLLYLRFQRLMTQEVQVSVHTKNGDILYNVRKRNLFVGTQVTLNHAEWPMGTHILRVKTSQGDLWKKRIQKTGQFVSN